MNSTQPLCVHLLQEGFCINCGALAYQNAITIKHQRYNYKAELSPMTVLYEMIASNDWFASLNELNKAYLNVRIELIAILRAMNSKLNFNSQTLFLSVCYLDQIFSKPIAVQSQREYVLYAVSCYLIASKYSENDPNVPELSKYLKELGEATHYAHTLTLDELGQGEIAMLKMLDYRLNVYSIYHFLSYFFVHGVILEPKQKLIEMGKGEVRGSQSRIDKKLLEQIYHQARELLDYVLDDVRYCFVGRDNAIGAIEIMRKAIELNVPFDCCNKDVFDLIYQIEQPQQRTEAIRAAVSKVYLGKTLKQPEKSTQSTCEDIEDLKQIPEKDNQSTKADTIQNLKKRMILNLSRIKASNLPNQPNPPTLQNRANKRLVTNLFDLKASSLKKRALSSSKDNDDTARKVSFIKGKIPNPRPQAKEQQLNQLNTHQNPLFQQYNRRPPVKSIRIKKDFISEQEAPNCANIASTTKSTLKSMQYEYPPVPKKEPKQHDLLDLTKKIFEQSKRNKEEPRDTHYSSNDVNRYKVIQSQTINESLPEPQGYNTIIINNNININTFIQRKDTYEPRTSHIQCNTNHLYDNGIDYMASCAKYQTSSSKKNVEAVPKQNYFGTYFDYDNDTTNKTLFGNPKGDLLNSSAIKKVSNKYMLN